jgi:glycerophosphoryl diester phosphodiesterase
MVVGHRGIPGRRPEETRASYELASDVGTDALEEDLHLSKDCVLVARHNAWLSDNTNVAEVAKTNPEVLARKRTVPGVSVAVKWDVASVGGPSSFPTDQTDPNDPKSVLKSLVVDGADHVDDWAISDFTAQELHDWIGGTTFDAKDERSEANQFNGQYPILTFQEIIDIARAKSKETGRQIIVYPETKNPTWNTEQAIANGCGTPGSRPLEDALIKAINDNGLNSKDAPIIVQSFEPSSLKYMRSNGLKTRVIQLIGAADVDFKTGKPLYNDIPDSRPYDWTVAGDPRTFGVMLTPDGLAEIKTYADIIGPWKPQIVPLIVPTPSDPNGRDGGYGSESFVGKTDLAVTQPANTVVADAHKVGLMVHPYTFRNESRYLAADYNKDPRQEYLKFFRLGVDGVFTDFSDTAVDARKQYLKELGR